jgi:hypothetical protein
VGTSSCTCGGAHEASKGRRRFTDVVECAFYILNTLKFDERLIRSELGVHIGPKSHCPELAFNGLTYVIIKKVYNKLIRP